MAEATTAEAPPRGGPRTGAGAAGRPARKRRVVPLLVGLFGAAGAAGGAYWAVSDGLLPPPLASIHALLAPAPAPPWAGWQAPDYVALPPMTLSLGAQARARHLRIRLTLEIAPGAEAPVREAEPRIIATLVRLLRAVDERDFEHPAQMLRLQSQMLRRVHLVTPPETVRAILIQEFMID